MGRSSKHGGVPSFVKNTLRKKLDPSAKKMSLVGYQDNFRNYRLYNFCTKKIVVSRHIVFNKNESSPVECVNVVNVDFRLNPVSNEQTFDEKLEFDEEFVDAHEVDDVDIHEVTGKHTKNEPKTANETCRDHKSKRVVRGVDADDKVAQINLLRLRDRNLIYPPSRYEANIVDFYEPTSYTDALSCPETGKWVIAVDEELR